MIRFTFPALLAVVLLAAPALAGGPDVGQVADDFTLTGTDGSNLSLSGLLGTNGVQVLVVQVDSFTCPFSLRADKDVVPMAKEYAGKGVRFLAIYPNEQDVESGIAKHARDEGFTHPAARDPGGTVSKALGAELTPTFYVFDKGRVLRYRGNLESLSPALDAVLAGETVERPNTPPTGCTIKWANAAPAAAAPAPADTPDRRPAPDRRGPPSDRPFARGGDRPAELSESARAWLIVLVDGLTDEDPMVRRSRQAGVMAYGSAALPHLKKAREGAEGEVARELDRMIGALSARQGAPDRPGAGARGGRGGRSGRAGSMLDNQKRMLNENLELSEEQKAALDKAFADLAPLQAEVGQAFQNGDREAGREKIRELMEKTRAALEGILTPEQMEQVRELMQRRGGRRRGGGGGGGR